MSRAILAREAEPRAVAQGKREMDVLIVEALEPDVVRWLEARHPTRYDPLLQADTPGLRKALLKARALISPSSVALDAQALNFAPLLRAVGRLSAGVEILDVDACTRGGIEVVRPGTSSAAAEAEFAVAAMLQLLRRVPVLGSDGLLVGRELGGARVGVVGMSAAARPLAGLLQAFGAQVFGYDPAVHLSDGLWAAWGIEPMGLHELIGDCDVLCVLLNYVPRYRGLLGERLLGECKNAQVLVSLAHSSLFDETALADALDSGRMAAAWFDSLEPGMLDFGRPLRAVRNLQVTPRLASTTRESRLRAAWAVARRIDEILCSAPRRFEFRSTLPGDLPDREAGRASA